jgi:hypothetical protein
MIDYGYTILMILFEGLITNVTFNVDIVII